MAVCVAVIGKDNAPKYLICSEENELDFHYKVHMSLDIIEEKENLVPDKKSDDLYLGPLYSTEEHRLLKLLEHAQEDLDIKFNVVEIVCPPNLTYKSFCACSRSFKLRYGYVTNTKIKFVVIFKSSSNSPRENEIKAMMKNIHSAYIDVVCNPFYTPGEPIKSKKFDSTIRSMLTKI